ncbi:MAG: Gfo/Idh/MocA family oxidoreductase [Bifidobacteriaceae bacterium]|jgi:predicted dehydrogenase|nr:Gfo/Idh/MocA family oxidoreductase [Bifidobacteriaceae bacterium]
MQTPARFAVVGTGWRAEFFCRLARALPAKLEVSAVIGRTAQSAARVAERWGVKTARLDDLPAQANDFVAVAVPWPDTPGLTADLAEAGHHVLAETPPAPDLEGLRALWRRLRPRRELVQVAEQYPLMPGHAARLAVCRSEAIGRVNSVEVASTHLYHAAALVRSFLGVGLTATIVTARAMTAPLIDPLRFEGWLPDPRPEPRTTHLAILDFGQGRHGLYNFVDNQWWNPLLHRRITIRGSAGEIQDDAVIHWSGAVPVNSRIEYRRAGIDLSLEGNEIKEATFEGQVVWSNAHVGANLSEDDLAVADHLCAEGAYARDQGPAPYPLAGGLHDHAIGLAIEASARQGRDLPVESEPWMEAAS